jgi:type IV secretory pathway VirB4 component
MPSFRLWPIRVPPHRATTASLQAAYPFLNGPGLGPRGAYVGQNCYGGAFCFDPFELYADGVITNPNLLVVGAVGSGKSSLVKTLLWRALAFGIAAWVADPKGEYGDLAAAADAPVVRLGPGQHARLNPLDHANDDDDCMRLVAALGSTALARALTPLEHAALTLALELVRHGSTPILSDLVEALLSPTKQTSAELQMSVPELRAASRDIALVLRRMCHGDLAGIFDGPTNVVLDTDVPLVVVDLSEVYHRNKEALPLVMCAATAWLQTAIASQGCRRYVVVDEAWALLNQPATARWLQQSYKLARAHGVANIAVLHRFSDLASAGAAGSETVALARGLLSDVGTRVVYAQPASEVKHTREVLDLSGTEAELLPQLPQGTALWKVGTRSFLVEHQRSDIEIAMTDTDARMRGRAEA